MAFLLIYGNQFGHGLTSPSCSGCGHLKDVFSVDFCPLGFIELPGFIGYLCLDILHTLIEYPGFLGLNIVGFLDIIT